MVNVALQSFIIFNSSKWLIMAYMLIISYVYHLMPWVVGIQKKYSLNYFYIYNIFFLIKNSLIISWRMYVVRAIKILAWMPELNASTSVFQFFLHSQKFSRIEFPCAGSIQVEWYRFLDRIWISWLFIKYFQRIFYAYIYVFLFDAIHKLPNVQQYLLGLEYVLE